MGYAEYQDNASYSFSPKQKKKQWLGITGTAHHLITYLYVIY